MIYPEQLLPRLSFKEITADLSGYFLCRKVLDKTLLNEPLPPLLSEELLGIETANDCFDYSTNLPGIFEPHYNLIEFIGNHKAYFRRYWDWITEIVVPVFEEDFSINENIAWFFLQVDKINGLAIPFNRKADNSPNEVATAVIAHTPTNSNFWHFSIKWRDANGYISTTNSKWKSNIIATVRALLSELMVITNVEQHIPKDWYMQN